MINQKVRILLLLMASFLSFAVYCIIWVEWFQNFTAGTYTTNYLEAIIETVVLVGYTYFAIRFAYSRLNTLL